MRYPAPRALAKARTQLLLHKRWAYLRYLHLREALIDANRTQEVATFLAVGCGRGVAEVTLAIEHPHIQFHLTDVESDRTPNFQQAQKMADEWGIPNVTFGTMDIFEPTKERFDFVATVEVLEHLEDDDLAAKMLTNLARRFVFTLTPFAHDAANADPVRRQRVWETNEHFVVGYDEKRLRQLFPSTTTVRGCYWADAGLPLRQELTNTEDPVIRERAVDYFRTARADVRDWVPRDLTEAAGIWSLARVDN